jgi:hypothetical protein
MCLEHGPSHYYNVGIAGSILTCCGGTELQGQHVAKLPMIWAMQSCLLQADSHTSMGV